MALLEGPGGTCWQKIDPAKVTILPGGHAERAPRFDYAGVRDAVCHVRAIRTPTPHSNGLNCVYDAKGECCSLQACRGDEGNDCLADFEAQARAWASTIFVDFRSSVR